jgi:hypothetical protein
MDIRAPHFAFLVLFIAAEILSAYAASMEQDKADAEIYSVVSEIISVADAQS